MSHVFLDTESLDVLTVIRYIWIGDNQQENDKVVNSVQIKDHLKNEFFCIPYTP